MREGTDLEGPKKLREELNMGMVVLHCFGGGEDFAAAAAELLAL